VDYRYRHALVLLTLDGIHFTAGSIPFRISALNENAACTKMSAATNPTRVLKRERGTKDVFN
jgi:hypothetical protein